MNITSFLRGFAGALAGGASGYAAFSWLATQGLYAMVLPGALVGLGCGYLSGIRSITLGVMSAICAFGVSVYAEWRLGPFVVDDSFAFFVAHLHELKTVKLIMMAVGTLLGFWFGLGRDRLRDDPRKETHRETA